MTPDLSREIGLIMGKTSPSPTFAERDAILDGAAFAEEWDDLPEDIQELLQDMRTRPNPYLPPEKRTEPRALRLSSVERRIIKDSDQCPQCVANNDPAKVPVHPNCHCDVVTNTVETGVAESSRLLDVLRSGQDLVELEMINGELPAAIQLNPQTVAVFDPEDVRYADLARWLEQVQPYLDATDQYISIVVDEDTDEALSEISETVTSITENPEELIEALKKKKLWFAIGQAVV